MAYFGLILAIFKGNGKSKNNWVENPPDTASFHGQCAPEFNVHNPALQHWSRPTRKQGNDITVCGHCRGNGRYDARLCASCPQGEIQWIPS